MKYQIELSKSALEDIVEAVQFIATDTPTAAHRWLELFEQRLQDVRAMPKQFGLIPEAGSLGQTYRSFLHFSHRVIYRVDEEALTIFIVRVYHGARRPLNRRDLGEPEN